MDVRSADPPEGPEFAQSFAVVAGGIGRQAYGFTDCSQAPTSTTRCQRVLEGKFRLEVDEPPRHHQVLRDPLGAAFLEVADLSAGDPIEFITLDVLIDLRRPFAIRPVGAAEVTRIVGARPCRYCVVRPASVAPIITATLAAAAPVLAIRRATEGTGPLRRTTFTPRASFLRC